MRVEARFKVASVAAGSVDSVEVRTVTLQATINADGNEDWSRWTPSGEIEMHITNEKALHEFNLNDVFKVTFERIPCNQCGR